MAGSATIGSLRVVLGIDTAMFDQGLADAMKSLKGIGKSMQSAGKTMSAALTAPILGFGALTVKTAGDFEAAMNRVDAATGASGDEFKALRDLALDLGANTSKSASESADMLEMLAKNGLSAGQILDGAAESAIKLSEATGGDLSRSADVATNVMAQFGLEAKDLSTVVDQITSVTLASQFEFDDYALALGQAGGVAGSLGVTLTDFNAALAATSSVFNSGSDAGTSFKSFLTRLVPASDTAAAAMEKLGLKFFEADGSMKSISAVADELRIKMAGLSDEEMNQAMTDIFGVDGMRTAIMLMKEGGAGIDAMIEKLNQKGVADEQAAARMKGFNGEMEKLGGAFENLQIAIADSGLLQMVTDFVTKLAEWIDALAETNPEILKWGTIIAGVAAALGPLVFTLGMVATAIAAVGAPVAAVIAGLTALTAAVVAFWPEITAAASAINAFLSDAWARFVSAWDGMVEKVRSVGVAIVQFTNDVLAAFAALPAKMMEIGGQIIDGLWNGIKAKWETVKGGIAGIGTGIADSIKSTLGIHSPSRVMHEVGVNIMQGLSGGMTSLKGQVVGVANTAATDVAGALKGAEAAFDGVGESASSAFSGIGSSIAAAIKGTKEWSDVLADVLGQFANMALSQLSSGFGGGFGGGLGGIFTGLLGGLFGFANGGSFMVGGAGGIDSQLVAFKASPNERVTVTKPGQDGRHGGAQMVQVMVGIDPSNGTIAPYVNSSIEKATPGIVSQSVARSDARAPASLAKYQAQRAGGDYRNS